MAARSRIWKYFRHMRPLCDEIPTGSFYKAKKKSPYIKETRFQYRPSRRHGCRFEDITRGQILDHLGPRTVVVAGDSMIRQLFERLVQSMRGQTRSIDYNFHTFAQYLVCPEVDAFRLSTNSQEENTSPDDEHLANQIPGFFHMQKGPGLRAAMSALSRCSLPPTQFHYLHAPTWQRQADLLPRYTREVTGAPFHDDDEGLGGDKARLKPIVITSVGYWESDPYVEQSPAAKDAPVSAQYLETLKSIQRDAELIMVVSVPTARMGFQDQVEEQAKRNEFMREWVNSQKEGGRGGRFVFVDFAAMTNAENTPPAASNGNWHYMCYISWLNRRWREVRPGEWAWDCADCNLAVLDSSGNATTKAQVLRGQVFRIHATEDGQCMDEMNRNMWNSIFNLIQQRTPRFSRVNGRY